MISLLLSTILVISDPHLLAPELHDNGLAYTQYLATTAGRDLENTDKLWDAFLQKVLQERPSLVLITGDLTNQGERESHLMLAKSLALLRQRGIQTLVIPGNHDINNPWARSFRADKQIKNASVSPNEFAQIYKDFGYGKALDRDSGSLSYLYELNSHQWILMLDSARYDLNEIMNYPEVSGGFSAKTLDWIRACGKRAQEAGAQLIAAQHHSLVDHSSVITDGYTVDDSQELLRVFQEADISLVLSGHIHIQDISSGGTGRKTVYDIASNALSVYPNQYGKIKWDPISGSIQYASKKIAAQGSPLDEHSRAVFRAGVTALFPESAKDLLMTLNENYFAGREDLNAALVQDPAYKRLLLFGGFLSRYVESMTRDFDTLDDNYLDLRP